MKYTKGSRVCHTSTGGHGWHSSKRCHRYGTILKETLTRVSVVWDDGKKSSVTKETITVIEG